GQPVWVWDSFAHLDINRHPYLFPDWTHSNSLLYSADDHNLVLSMRHQNWVIKIDYEDGAGSGNVLWRLGEGGDFKLVNGVDPTDWFYAQHGLDYFSANTSGVFRLGVMDNGDDRPTPDGSICGKTGEPACYSTASVLEVDEGNRTATLVYHYNPSPSLYSYFGGDVRSLINGDLETDFCALTGGSRVLELNLNGSTPQLVWQAFTPGALQYRAERLPSLYPGVQW
ncbi:MAG TPA: aryl-sulfate sulfotransferase, partial [Terracidiphilus sp.]|nr:aryl-sulfate sulfotransferase [Terracidiphilus sp.]